MINNNGGRGMNDFVRKKWMLVIFLFIMIFMLEIMEVVVRTLNIPEMLSVISLSLLFCSIMGILIVIIAKNTTNNLEQELKEQVKIRSSILNLAQDMTMIHSNTELHDLILKTAVEVLPHATMGSIMILDCHNILEFTSVVGFELEQLQAIRLPIEESYLYNKTKGKVNKAVIINNAQVVNQEISGSANEEIIKTTNTDLINTTISSPLYIDNKLYGMMNIDSEVVNAFSESDVDLMNFFALEAIKVIKLYDTIEENNRLSKFDPLTNLYNRRYLHHRLEKLTKESMIFSLVSIDINNLKEVNDEFGHDLGDALLLAFVTGISSVITKKDLFSRYGGDEFIVVFYEKTEAEVIDIIEETVIPTFNNKIIHEKLKDIRVSFSYGITSYPEDSQNYEKLMIKADQLMYANKRAFHMKNI